MRFIKSKNSDSKLVVIDKVNQTALLMIFSIDYPGDRKIMNFIRSLQYDEKLFYNVHVEWKLITILFKEVNEINEKLLSFFGDVDVLLTTWN